MLRQLFVAGVLAAQVQNVFGAGTVLPVPLPTAAPEVDQIKAKHGPSGLAAWMHKGEMWVTIEHPDGTLESLYLTKDQIAAIEAKEHAADAIEAEIAKHTVIPNHPHPDRNEAGKPHPIQGSDEEKFQIAAAVIKQMAKHDAEIQTLLGEVTQPDTEAQLSAIVKLLPLTIEVCFVVSAAGPRCAVDVFSKVS